MGRLSREFVKLETRILNDHRFFTMSEFEQLVFIKLLGISRSTSNQIPKKTGVVGELLRTKRNITEVKSAINRIKQNFPKFKENKYFYYFEDYELRLNNSAPKLHHNPCVDVDEDIDKDKDVDKEQKKTFSFEDVYIKYPNKVGKKAAELHFKVSVKNEQDFLDINTALKNYLASERVAKGFIMNASTFFNNWRDWINYKETLCLKCKGAGVFTSTTGFEIICDCPKGIGKTIKTQARRP